MSALLTIPEMLERLELAYGPPARRKRLEPLDELVLTVLSQNTSDRNSRPAFQRLRERFPRWQDMAQAREEDIAAAIRSGGLAQIKARRLKFILEAILAERGSLNLEFLQDWPPVQARAWLRGLPGVGPKTAACVLLFSLDMPTLPVDTHVYRVSLRLGLIEPGVSRDKAHQELEAVVPPAEIYRFHVLLIEHGRRACKARHPLCAGCVLVDGCPYYLNMVWGRKPQLVKIA